MRKSIVLLAAATLLYPLLPAHFAAATHQSEFSLTHNPPSAAYTGRDLAIDAHVHSNCDSTDGWFPPSCDEVVLTVSYVDPVGITKSIAVRGSNTVEQDFSTAIPGADITGGVFRYHLEASQTYCVFFGCLSPDHDTWGSARLPESGDYQINVLQPITVDLVGHYRIPYQSPIYLDLWSVGSDTLITHVGWESYQATPVVTMCAPPTNCIPPFPDDPVEYVQQAESDVDEQLEVQFPEGVLTQAAATALQQAYQASPRDPALTKKVAEQFDSWKQLECDATPSTCISNLNPVEFGRAKAQQLETDASFLRQLAEEYANTTVQASHCVNCEEDMMFDDDCLSIDGKAYWRGCYHRFRVNDSVSGFWHLADQGLGSGHGKGYGIKTGRVGFRHRSEPGTGGSPHTITLFKPPGTINLDNGCSDVTVSATLYALTISETQQFCPESISIKADQPGYFRSQWNYGSGPGSRGRDETTTTIDFAKIPDANGDYFTIFIYYYSRL